jgi:hypothetical protein
VKGPEITLVRAMRLLRDSLAAGPKTATSRLADGTVGYHMRRTDDCWRAAVATCLQVPIEELPDARIDQRLAAGEPIEQVDEAAWSEMCEWLAARGWTLIEHSAPPVHLDRWIGIVPVNRPFASHSLVMTGPRVLFDPSAKPGVRTFYPIEVKLGYSFTKET